MFNLLSKYADIMEENQKDVIFMIKYKKKKSTLMFTTEY